MRYYILYIFRMLGNKEILGKGQNWMDGDRA